MKANDFSWKARGRSFAYAGSGLARFFEREHNAWLHLLATVAVLGLAAATDLSKTEWLALVFAIGFVWVTELLNTAIEKLMDFVSVHRRPEIKFIKDISAAAVMLAAITALAVGCIIFLPKIV